MPLTCCIIAVIRVHICIYFVSLSAVMWKNSITKDVKNIKKVIVLKNVFVQVNLLCQHKNFFVYVYQ